MANINDFLPAQYQNTPAPVQKPVPTAPNIKPNLKAAAQNSDSTAPPSLPPSEVNPPLGRPAPKKKKTIATAILLLLLLVGSVAAYTLMNRQQDTRQQATYTFCANPNPVECYGQNVCGENNQLLVSCKESSDAIGRCWKLVETCENGCRNAQCDPVLPPKPTDDPCFGANGFEDACVSGSPNICQATGTGGNSNTGYMCSCVPAGGPTGCYIWRCNDYQPDLCPISSTAPTRTDGACINGFERLVNGCLRNTTKTTLYANQYTCPEMTWAKAGSGCPNSKDINSTPYTTETIAVGPGQTVCLGDDYCGVRQIDGDDGAVPSSCFVSAYRSCEIGEPSPSITTTPTVTQKPKISCSESGCQTDDDCSAGLVCVQPKMPDCPEGLNCAQVMPAKVCAESEYQTACIDDPSWETCCEAVPDPLMCRKIEILDQYNQILLGDADQDFSPNETTLKFRCYASDAERVDRFEYAVIQPDGTIVYLAEGSNTPAISEPYLITQRGDFNVECRVCESPTRCQPYVDSRLPITNRN